MARVQSWSEREVERRSTALARLLRRAWRAVSRAVSGSLRDEPGAPVAAANQVQPIWNRHVDDDVLAYLGDVYVDAAEDVLLELDAGPELLVGEDLVQLYLRTASNRLRGVGDHAWERVRNHLLEGQRTGEPLEEIAARIAGAGGISDARALTIARTEVHAAAESAAWEQARFVDPDALKVWLATNDARTRPSHRAAEGQAVSMDEFFIVGDSKLRFPGDPLGDAAEVVNCRCTLVFDFESSGSEPSALDSGALVAAAKKWNPISHPRGKDGRFIKKGAVQTLLAKPSPNITTVTQGVSDLDEKQWKQLTDEQKTYIVESVGKLPSALGSTKAVLQQKVDKLQDADPISSKPPKKPGPGTKKPDVAEIQDATGKTLVPGSPAHSALTKGNYDFWEAVAALDQKTWNDLTQEQRDEINVKAHDYENESDWESQEAVSKVSQLAALQTPAKTSPVTKSTSAPAPASPSSPVAPPQQTALAVSVTPQIPAHKGAVPGSPAKVSTALIWGKYEPGTVILEAPDEQVTWDGKKYVHSVQGLAQAEWTKKDAYAQLKSDTHWQVPGGAVASEPTAENFAADMKAMWQSQWEKGLVTTEEFEAQFGEPPFDPDGPVAQLPSKSGIKGQSGMTLEAGQLLFDSGDMSLNEFEDEFGLTPEGYEDPGPLPAPTPPTPVVPQPDWPDKVEMSVPKGPGGGPLSGYTKNAIQAQLDAAATKPADFDPNAGIQTEGSAFYSALQSLPYDPKDKQAWHALRTYQSHAAEEWNRALRHDLPLADTKLTAQQKKWVETAQTKLDEMFAQSALPTTMRVWRGVKDVDGSLEAKLGKGTIFEDKGYSSTATKRSVSESFAGYGGLLFDIEVPKGEQGLTPTKWSGRFLEEWELLLPRGSKFEVIEAPKQVGNHRVVKVRVVTGEHDDIKKPNTSLAATPTAPAATSTAPAQGKNELLGLLKFDGKLGPEQSVDLVGKLEQSDFNQLTNEQVTALTVGVDDALVADLSGAKTSFKKLNDLIIAKSKINVSSTPEPLAAPPTPPPAPVVFRTGSSIIFDEAKKYLLQTVHSPGTVVGQSANGRERLVATDETSTLGGTPLYRHERFNTATSSWESYGSVTGISAIQIIRGISTSASAEPDWLVPKELFHSSLGAGVATPSPAVTLPEPVNPVAAVPDTLDVSELGAEASPGAPVNWESVVDLLVAGEYTAGEVVAESTDGKLIFTKAKYGSLLVKDKSTGEMLSAYSEGDIKSGFVQDDMPDKSWVYPNGPAPTLTPASSVAPTTPTPTPTPVTPTPPAAPSTVSSPGTGVTDAHKKLFKTGFKEAGVGYWSKPETIWTELEQLQKIYPQYSTLQIIQSLDEQLKTKQPKPFETKMIKWLGTAKGKKTAGSAAASFTPGSPGLSPTGASSSTWGSAPDPSKSTPGKLPEAGGIDHLSGAQKSEIYADFKKLPGTYYTSAPTTINAAAGAIATKYGISLLQALKVIDEIGAQKVGKKNAHLFEKKIKTWLATPTGVADAVKPGAGTLAEQRTPKFSPGIDPNVQIPTRAESDQLKYPVVINEAAAATLWAEMQAQHGPIKPGQRASVKKYTGSKFTAMNNWLRGKSAALSNADLNSVKSVQAGLRPSTQPVTLVRGTNWVGSAKTLAAIQGMIGQTWRTDSFMSASIGNNPGYGGGKNIWLYVEAPPGTPMVWADPYSQNKGEREMILGAGLHFEVISAKEGNPPGYPTTNKLIVHVRVVPDPKVVKS